MYTNLPTNWQFLLTPNALSICKSELPEIYSIISDRTTQGFFPFVHNVSRAREYGMMTWDRLPIYFVTDNDLGKTININDCIVALPLDNGTITMVSPKRHLEVIVPKYIESFNLDKILDVANERGNRDGQTEGELELTELIKLHHYSGVKDSNWLGLYEGGYFLFGNTSIFIRIDKIKSNNLLNSPIGIASVILHEMGHAIMDNDENFQKLPRVIKHLVEEPLANYIALRCLRSRRSKRDKNDISNVEQFMRSQRSPYPLGVKIANAQGKQLDFIGKTYILRWIKAKKSSPIRNLLRWVYLVNNTPSFTDSDLKDQIKCLFG